MEETKFCKWCGEKIAADAEICPKCGRRVEAAPATAAPQVIINNSNQNANTNINAAVGATPVVPLRARNKWTAFFLCLFLGFFGAHKFYEGKSGMGVLYLFTMGLFGVGVIVDLITILGKPRIYYVY